MVKILSQSRYDELLKASRQVEEKAVDAKLEDLTKRYERIVKEKNNEIEHLNKQIKNLEEDQEIEIDRTLAKVDVEISTATKELNQKIQELTISNANYKKEAEILTKAFENLGFDVKDMKEILNKLVDGVVAKNEVKVISTSK